MQEITHGHVPLRSGASVEIVTSDAMHVAMKARRWGTTLSEFIEPAEARLLAAALAAGADRVDALKRAAVVSGVQS